MSRALALLLLLPLLTVALCAGCTEYEIRRPRLEAPVVPALAGGAAGSREALPGTCRVRLASKETIEKAGLSSSAMDDEVTKTFARVARDVGLFRGTIRGDGEPDGPMSAYDVVLEPRIRVIEAPEGDGGFRNFLAILCCMPGLYFGWFFFGIWTERDPPVRLEYALVAEMPPGEPVALWSTRGEAIVAAQQGPPGGAWVFSTARKLDALAAEALLSQARSDEAFRKAVRDYVEIPPETAPELGPLLVAEEQSVSRARWRNRMLLQAKTLTLPALLREGKTAELQGLTIKTERSILDLNHAAEVATDSAQTGVEKGGTVNGRPAAEHRELGIAYRERIEILKPILAALREEVANRGR